MAKSRAVEPKGDPVTRERLMIKNKEFEIYEVTTYVVAHKGMRFEGHATFKKALEEMERMENTDGLS